MLELSFEKLVVIGLLAAFLLGPQHLPRYATQLARFIRVLRHMASEARGRLEEELGPDFDRDLRRLDPRQYDPRRIIRDALADDPDDRTGRDAEGWESDVPEAANEPTTDEAHAPAARTARRTPMAAVVVDDEAT